MNSKEELKWLKDNYMYLILEKLEKENKELKRENFILKQAIEIIKEKVLLELGRYELSDGTIYYDLDSDCIATDLTKEQYVILEECLNDK